MANQVLLWKHTWLCAEFSSAAEGTLHGSAWWGAIGSLWVLEGEDVNIGGEKSCGGEAGVG